MVYPKTNRAALDQVVLRIKEATRWKHRKPLHFIDIRGEKRKCLVDMVASASALFRSVVVMIHKPSLEEPETFRKRHRLYFYAVRLLLERASWICRDSRTARDQSLGDGTATVIFSNRNDLSYVEMKNYFIRLQGMETSIEGSVIRPGQFETLSNGRMAGLQVADTIASAFYCTNHHCARSVSEHWAETLRPTVYRREGKYRGYGLKFFPPSAEKQVAQGTLAPWATRIYPV